MRNFTESHPMKSLFQTCSKTEDEKNKKVLTKEKKIAIFKLNNRLRKYLDIIKGKYIIK